MKIKSVTTKVTCPGCGQKIGVIGECPWCHYPTLAGPASGQKSNALKKQSRLGKVLNNAVTSFLVLVIAALVFLHFSPGYGIYVVRSGSMTPTIRTGDIIITGPVNGFLGHEVKPGTIITFKRGKDLVTHRVQSIDGDKLTTKGDALEEADPWQTNLSDVVGTYLLKIPYLGYLPYFARTKLGWFLLILLPSAVLVGLLVKDIVKEALSP